MTGKVFVSGRFNVLHSGHLRLLKFAKSLGKELVVGVYAQEDSSSITLVNLEERVEALSLISVVDRIVVARGCITKVLDHERPSIIVKGREFAARENLEKAWCDRYGAELVFSSGEWHDPLLELNGNSSDSNCSLDFASIIKFLERNCISKSLVTETISAMANVKAVTLGDVIVDEYILCEPLGMSREEPSIVLKPLEEKMFLGGAAIVASHIKSLGGDSTLVSVIGDDAIGDWAKRFLKDIDVKNELITSPERTTTKKTRFRVRGASANYSLFRVSRLTEQDISLSLQNQLIDHLFSSWDDSDLLIFSDFNYGLLPDYVIEKVTREAKSRNILLAADSQTSSQVGDIGRYLGVDLVFATEYEARTALNNKDDGLIVLSDRLVTKTGSKAVFLKMGADGALIHSTNHASRSDHYVTEKLPALNITPLDVSGAGDSMLAASAMAFVASQHFHVSFLIGAIVAALQVNKVGNSGISYGDLNSVVKSL